MGWCYRHVYISFIVRSIRVIKQVSIAFLEVSLQPALKDGVSGVQRAGYMGVIICCCGTGGMVRVVFGTVLVVREGGQLTLSLFPGYIV